VLGTQIRASALHRQRGWPYRLIPCNSDTWRGWKNNDERLLVAEALEVCLLRVPFILPGLEGISARKITGGSNDQSITRIKRTALW
jgi:hypothetical protein